MGIGGTEQVIRQLVTGLPADRFQNQILCIDGHIGEIGRQIQKEGKEVFGIARGKGFDLSLVKKIRQKIQEKDIDIVHCHQYTPWVYGWLAARGTKARVIFTEHGRFHPDRYRYKAMLINPLIAMMTSSVVAISEATRSALAKYEFIPKQKIRVIYNGIRGLEVRPDEVHALRESLGVTDTELLLGTVARLDPVKNQALMLTALAQILPEYPSARLLLVGDGPDRDNLEQLAGKLAIADRTIFTGFREEPASYLAAMDLFLLSSHTEGTSMTLLEAMSLGITAVATRVGGNPEIVVDEKTGILTEPGSVQSFAAAIERLLDDVELRKHMSEKSKDVFSRKFSVEKMVDSYVSLYDAACWSLPT
ncbi:MAG: glycosyltransferase [Rickettsiales bacterium]